MLQDTQRVGKHTHIDYVCDSFWIDLKKFIITAVEMWIGKLFTHLVSKVNYSSIKTLEKAGYNALFNICRYVVWKSEYTENIFQKLSTLKRL